MYFAHSRVRSLTGVPLIATFTAPAVNADPSAILEYKKLRLENQLLSQTFLLVSCAS